MSRVFGSSCLIAGTAIGAGILALPLVLVHLSLWQSIALMILVWILAYYSALLGSELVLRAKSPLSLGALSHRFSGRGAQILGQISFLLLCYALMSAYLDGTASLIHAKIPDLKVSLLHVLTAGGYFAILVLSITAVDRLNRLLFGVMLLILFGFTVALATYVDWNANIESVLPHGSWTSVFTTIPVVFTSFGFQIIFHTISDYLEMCPKKIRKSFFWGSLTPAIAYIIWTSIALLVLASQAPDQIAILKETSMDVGTFMTLLGSMSHSPIFLSLSWLVSILAIVTSGIGVSLGIFYTLNDIFKNRIVSALLTLLPTYTVVSLVPGAFIKALGFAGMILVIIALLLPMYLLYKSDDQTSFYPVLRIKIYRWLVIFVSLGIMAIEILHLLNRL